MPHDFILSEKILSDSSGASRCGAKRRGALCSLVLTFYLHIFQSHDPAAVRGTFRRIIFFVYNKQYANEYPDSISNEICISNCLINRKTHGQGLLFLIRELSFSVMSFQILYRNRQRTAHCCPSYTVLSSYRHCLYYLRDHLSGGGVLTFTSQT